MSEPDKALTLAAQINDLHQQIIKGFNKGTLDYAIQAGDLLILQKENVKAEKGKWLEWLTDNCHDIPQTTASLYMRLAANKRVFNQQRVANLATKETLSLRGALKLIPKTPEQKQKAAEATANRAAAKAQKVAEAAKAKEFKSAEAMLEAIDANELFTAMRHVWDKEKVEELAGILADHLKPQAASPMPPPDPPEYVRRV